jgi:S-adenosylmethionine decarboxylase
MATMAIGKHIILDLWVGEQTAPLLEFLTLWPELLTTAALRSGATIIGQQFHQFEPRGVTGFLLLAESHISVHTFPEEKLATLDIFTCGNMDEELAIAYLREQLLPVQEKITVVLRGA